MTDPVSRNELNNLVAIARAEEEKKYETTLKPLVEATIRRINNTLRKCALTSGKVPITVKVDGDIWKHIEQKYSLYGYTVTALHDDGKYTGYMRFCWS